MEIRFYLQTVIIVEQLSKLESSSLAYKALEKQYEELLRQKNSN